MLKFVLFGFPVRIHWMFWLLTVFLGMGYLGEPGRAGPIAFVISSLIILVSILFHELGHAWARRRCGHGHSEITLYGMGGLCSGSGYLTRKQSMFVSAMGPAASLLLGSVALLFFLSPSISWNSIRVGWLEPANVFIFTMLFVNIGWAIMNLLPVMPLDGGQIFAGFMANKNPGIVPKVGMVVAGAVAVLGLMTGQLWLGFLFGFLAYKNYQRVVGGHSGFW